MAAQENAIVRLEALRRTTSGIWLLRAFALQSLLILGMPSLLAVYLGMRTDWYTGAPEVTSWGKRPAIPSSFALPV